MSHACNKHDCLQEDWVSIILDLYILDWMLNSVICWYKKGIWPIFSRFLLISILHGKIWRILAQKTFNVKIPTLITTFLWEKNIDNSYVDLINILL